MQYPIPPTALPKPTVRVLRLLMTCGVATAAFLACSHGGDRVTDLPTAVSGPTVPDVATVTDDPIIGDDSTPSFDDLEVRPEGAFTVLPLATPDSSGQAVHPDFAWMPGPVPIQFLVATPYTNGSSAMENPSLFAEGADFTWSPTGGVKNPIATPTVGYLSDPDIVAVPNLHELWVYYREVASTNTIQLIRSSDGVQFSAPVQVAEGSNHTIVSPSVVRRDSTHWLMWSVNAGVGGCAGLTTTVELRHSTNGIDWSPPAPVSLLQAGGFAWHIDVQWIPSRHEYWALYNLKPSGSCTTPALYLATSRDGVTWQSYPSPVLARGAIPEFADIVYRSTFAYSPKTDAIRFWYSGASYDAGQYVWRTAYQRRSRTSVFTAIGWGPARALASFAGRPGVPLLLDGL